MIDISVHNLVKSFEVGKKILDGLTFEINSGERVCLLGKNGAGKTTLFRILVGEIEEDEGEIVIPQEKRIGLISQIPVYPEGYTVEDVLKTAFAPVYAIETKLQRVSAQMAADSSPALLSEYDRLSEDYERLGGYRMDYERNRVANGLDIPPEMRERPFSQLSGGEKTRVNLARLILEDTDILLLDEPTNHLDLHATEWLEDYLLGFRGTVLAISHDRWFLDRIAQRTIELVSGKAEFYSGNYSFYVQEKQHRFEEQLRQYEKDQAKLKQLQEAADKLHLWAFMGADKLHKRAFSMEKRIEKLSQTERPRQERKMGSRFSEKAFNGDEVLVMEGVSKSFPDKTLFSDVSAVVAPGERIALIGDNGTGKSTLVKIITAELPPDTGYARRGPSIRTAYLPQHVQFDDENRSVLDTVLYETNCSPQAARDRLGAFKFSGEDVFKPVWALSGGEKSRLRLCILMHGEVNFLILDEPTNHLDLPSREWLEDALTDYDETLLFVSHDRYFIEKFATRIWDLENGVFRDYRGGFSKYRAYRQRLATAAPAPQDAKKRESAVKKDAKPGDTKKKPYQNPEKARARLEREIEKLEAQLADLDQQEAANASDYQKLLELGETRGQLDEQLTRLYEEWDALGI